MNYYEILGVSANATEQQIKEGYRREAMKWHPDRHEGAAAKGEAERRFKDLAQAYRTLSKPAARAEYDRQLEQNLRREYETRQQEQERERQHREQARREQAQQERARQEPPKPEFANTGPQFEEETVSGDDANQMFFEQMLDLAFELAGRGFPEPSISKALIALGCPESMARAVAAIAAKRGRANGSTPAASERDQLAVQNFDEAPWDELKPYFAAAIFGNSRNNPLADDIYNAILAKQNRRIKIWWALWAGSLILSIWAGAWKTIPSEQIIPLLAAFSSIFLILGYISSVNFLGPDKKRFFLEKRGKYYLTAFEAIHKSNTSRANKDWAVYFNWAAAIFNINWLGYRRQPQSTYIFITVYLVAYYIFIGFSSGKFEALAFPISILISIALGFTANSRYFQAIKSNIIKTSANKRYRNTTLESLRNKGGTNYFGWIIPLIIYTILCIPGFGIQIEREKLKAQAAEEARSAQAAVEKAAAEERQKIANENARIAREQAIEKAKSQYLAYVTQVERQYPFLDANSAYYDSRAEQWVMERMKNYETQGQHPEQALRSAIAEMEAFLAQRRQQQQP